MNNNILKENKAHGDSTFPLGTYYVDYSRNNIAIDCHWHDEFEFLLICTGSINFVIDSYNFTATAGDAVFINSGELHAGYLNSEANSIFKAVVFSPDLICNANLYDPIKEKYIDQLLKQRYRLPRFFSSKGHDWERTVIKEIEDIWNASEAKAFTYEIFIKSKLFSIFSILFSRVDINDISTIKQQNDVNIERLKKVMEYIHNNYNSRITIKELSNIVNMSEGHFIRLFKSMIRKNPVEYINYYRINKALRELEESSKKIIEISGDTGFDNVSYFVTVFKRYMNCTPGEYRKSFGSKC